MNLKFWENVVLVLPDMQGETLTMDEIQNTDSFYPKHQRVSSHLTLTNKHSTYQWVAMETCTI